MTIKRNPYLLILLCVIFLCCSKNYNIKAVKMNAIQLSNKLAVKEGIILNEFYIIASDTVLTIEKLEKKDSFLKNWEFFQNKIKPKLIDTNFWMVYYKRKVISPGGELWVFVDANATKIIAFAGTE